MSSTTLLIPFALPPAEHAKDLLDTLRLPALATLLARASEARTHLPPAFAAALPHERWLAGTDDDNSPPIARELMQARGMATMAGDGYWFLLQAVHLHIARDHLVLTDPQALVLDDSDARALYEAAAPLFSEAGHDIAWGDARHWFVRADAWRGLRTCTPAAASGHNIDIWQPRGPGERDWRRLHNEVQMLWHQHPVNEGRELSGLPRINALWLWAGSSPDSVAAPAYLAAMAGRAADDAGRLSIDARLQAASLAGDWAGWLEHMQALEAERFAPLLGQLKSGALNEATLLFSDHSRLAEWRVTRNGMRKFWRSPSLSRLRLPAA